MNNNMNSFISAERWAELLKEEKEYCHDLLSGIKTNKEINELALQRLQEKLEFEAALQEYESYEEAEQRSAAQKQQKQEQQQQEQAAKKQEQAAKKAAQQQEQAAKKQEQAAKKAALQLNW